MRPIVPVDNHKIEARIGQLIDSRHIVGNGIVYLTFAFGLGMIQGVAGNRYIRCRCSGELLLHPCQVASCSTLTKCPTRPASHVIR